MKVATIVPTPYLEETKEDSYFMCLYQEVKKNPEYAAFFKARKEEGKFVIMDNGAAEGVNPTAAELLPIYSLVEPNEIVLPDVVYNKEETVRRTKEAYNLFSEYDLEKKYKYMAVPQGETFSEWLECLRLFLQQTNITTIGVSKFVTPKFQKEMGDDANVRLECVDAIITIAEMMDRDIEIHLLGCWKDPSEIHRIAEVFGPKVRGTDSGIAYVYTRNNVEYTPGTDRPDNDEIDFTHGEVIDKALLRKNKEAYVAQCQ